MDSNKYLKITFTGEFVNVCDFLSRKNINQKPKKVSENTAYLKVNEELYDDVHYFKGTEFENGGKITDVVDIDVNEFGNVTEEGFNLLNKEIDSTYKQVKETADSIKTDALENLSEAILGTTLNSKSPLSDEDPFSFLISKDFLVTSLFAISAILCLTSV